MFNSPIICPDFFLINTLMKIKNYSLYRLFAWLFLPVFLLMGCQTVPSDLGGDSGPLFRRGIVVQSENGLEFQPCYVKKNEIIEDHTGRLNRYLERKNLHAVYAELSGDTYVIGEPWSVWQVHMIGGNTVTCGHELPGNTFRAAGDRPLWVADVREKGIFVQNYAELSQIVFSRTKALQLGKGYEWTSRMRGGENNNLTLRLLFETCRDRFGIEYEYRSEMVLNGNQFDGCARKGDLDLRSLPGLYTASSSGGNRFVTLELMSDGSLEFSQDYRNGQSVIIQKGSWQKLESGKFVFHVTESDGRAENEVMLFERDRRGGLVLKGYSSLYGAAGFRLEKKGPEKKHRSFNR